MYGVVLMVAVVSGGAGANFDHAGGGGHGNAHPFLGGGCHGGLFHGCHGGLCLGGGVIILDLGHGCLGGHGHGCCGGFGHGCFGHHGFGCFGHHDHWGCCGGHHEHKDKEKEKGKEKVKEKTTIKEKTIEKESSGEKSKEKSKEKEGDEEETSANAEPAPARLVVSLPADATLKVDGAATRSTGAERTFVTPALPAGKALKYTLQVEARNKDGKKVSWEQKATVRAGETTRITLKAPTTVASR
jgi:uncharacterized protein (TIGR03000 family)